MLEVVCFACVFLGGGCSSGEKWWPENREKNLCGRTTMQASVFFISVPRRKDFGSFSMIPTVQGNRAVIRVGFLFFHWCCVVVTFYG